MLFSSVNLLMQLSNQLIRWLKCSAENCADRARALFNVTLFCVWLFEPILLKFQPVVCLEMRSFLLTTVVKSVDWCYSGPPFSLYQLQCSPPSSLNRAFPCTELLLTGRVPPHFSLATLDMKQKMSSF